MSITFYVDDSEGNRSSLAVPVSIDAAPQFPDASNTGPSDESLVPIAPTQQKLIVDEPGLYENFHVERVQIKTPGVTLRNFRVTLDDPDYWVAVWFQPGVQDGNPRTLLENGHITSPVPSGTTGINGSHFTARRLHVDHMEDAFDGNNYTIEDSYIHDLIRYEGAHNDGVSTGRGNVEVKRCTILLPNQQTAAVNIVPFAEPIDNVLIEDCYLNGGAYTIYVRAQAGQPTPTNVIIRNNAFGRDYLFGILSSDGQGLPDLDWSGNYFLDTGEPV